MADDYIKVIYNYIVGTTTYTKGFKIFTNLIVDMSVFKGIETADISLPTSSSRILLPISGLKTDPTLAIELIDDGTNKCFSIDNIGNETALNYSTTKEQLNFLLDNLMRSELSAVYTIYIDWLDKEFVGLLTINGRIKGDSYFNNISLTASMKVGNNLFST